MPATPQREHDKKLNDHAAHVYLQVRDLGCPCEVFFRIRRSTELKKLFNAYCDRHSVDFNSICFIFEGRRLRAEQTPEELQMEDGDVIHAVLHFPYKIQGEKKTQASNLLCERSLRMVGMTTLQSEDAKKLKHIHLKAKGQLIKETVNEGTSSSSTPNSNKKDPGWSYCFCPNPNDATTVTCKFCGKTSWGGVYLQREHLIGKSRNVEACKKCPPEVKKDIENYVNVKKIAKRAACKREQEFGDDEMDVEVEEVSGRGKRSMSKSEGSVQKRIKGSVSKSKIGMMFMRQEDKGVKVSLRQPNIKEAFDKELSARTVQHIARFFYQAGLSFNVVRLDSFKTMIEAIGIHGPNLKPPSYHELRVPLLKKEVSYTINLMKSHKEEWAKHGCSIMLDGWTDKRQRTIINFLVNCSLGTMFVKSVDASGYVKSGVKLFDLLDKFVEEIGEQNVVQVITENGSNYVAAGKLLEIKRPHLYWTPCVVNCIDLMLEDIGKIDRVKQTLAKAIALVGYIYNHTGVLNMMREFTKKKELVRHGVTRFATTFLTLQSVYKQKQSLRNMFISDQWAQSEWAKDVKAKRAVEVVFFIQFWRNVIYILKVMRPLIHVLRLADNERKPAMGYMYEVMDRAKETIQKVFGDKEEMYKPIFEIIDKRWECQLHKPLHAAGHYLNPQFFYYDPSVENCEELVGGLMKCVTKLIPDISLQDKIMDELEIYKRSEGLFGNPMAVRSRKTKSPVQWWSMYGCGAPNLQTFAIKVLGLTCSASGCEKNWSIFEHIHAKKRNRLEHRRLQDLVYVKYNQTLKARYDRRNLVDPICLNDVDDSNEWLVGEMLKDEPVFENDSLTWNVVQQVLGAGEPRVNTRQSNASTSSSGVVQEEEFADEDTEEEEISGEYNYDEVDSDEEMFSGYDDITDMTVED